MASGMGSLVQLAHILWTHLLDQTDYGRFAILEGVVFGFAGAVLTLAPNAYILVNLPKKSRAELGEALGGLASLSFVIGTLAVVTVMFLPESLFVLGGEAIPQWAIAGVVVAATLSATRVMAQTINEAQSQPTRAALWSDFVDGTRPFIALTLFFLLSCTWEARWGGLVLAQAGAGIAALWILSRQGWLRRLKSLSALREPLRFSLPMIFAAIAYVGYQSADRLYVAIFNGVAAAGRYEAAYRLALLVSTVNVVTLHSFNPLFYAAYARGDRRGAQKLLRRTSLQVAGLVAALVVLLPLLAIYTPILEESYRTSRSVIVSIPILAAGLGLLGISLLWQAPLLASAHAKTASAIAVTAALVNLGADIVLVPRMGEVGAAWGTFVAFAVMLAMTLAVVRLRGVAS